MGKVARCGLALALLSAGVIASSQAIACVKEDVRWSGTSNTLYIQDAATCTPTALAAIV